MHNDITLVEFLSTPSGWRATIHAAVMLMPTTISIHALRVEGDDGTHEPIISPDISIHALRVEGDRHTKRCAMRSQSFLSTPSGWRATIRCDPVLQLDVHISIHALRVEGDANMADTEKTRGYFYPRPPGGGRQQKRTKFSSVFAQKGEEFASLRRGKRKFAGGVLKRTNFGF